MPGRLSLGDWASVDAPVAAGTPPNARAERRRGPGPADWADVTVPIVDVKRPRRPEGKRPAALRADALQLMVGVGVAGVVSAQTVTQAITRPSAGWGAVLVLLQASGPVFVALLTVFVLRACHHLRGEAAARFWISCVVASALTYVAWSAIYFIADAGRPRALPIAAGTFSRDLLTGSAQAHLGLVFVAVQFCVVMPVVRWLIRVTRGLHLRVLAVSVVLQLAISTVLHWVPVSGAANFLPAYLLFVVIGALFVDHQEELRDSIARRPGVVVVCLVTGAVVAEAGYALDLARHLASAGAAQSVAPGVTIAALAGVIGLAGAGAGWERGPRPWWQLRLLSAWSDVMTGVYLVSPLVVQVVLALLVLGGPGSRSARAPEVLTVALGLGCGLPLLLAVSSLLTAGLRRSPLSVVLTGLRPLPPATRVTSGKMIWNSGAGLAGLAILMAVAVAVPLFPQVGAPGGQATTTPGPAHSARPVSPVAAATTATMHTITVGGLRRSYEVIRPQHPMATKLPVLVFLHGANTGLGTEENRDGLLTYVSAGQAILVYAAGLHESWNDGACCGFAHRHRVDDVPFLSRVVRASASIRGADPKAVYLGGYGDGGKMAYDLICRHPRLVTGAVVIAAVPDAACPAGPPVPLLQVAGNKDPVNRYQRVVQQVRDWVRRNRCATSASGDDAYDTLTLQRWSTCAHGSSVEFATYDGAGHSPFGGGGAPPLARVMMSFVERSPFTG